MINGVFTVGLGSKSVQNQASALQQLSGSSSNVFYSFNADQLQFVTQWLYQNGCPNIGMPTTTVPPPQPLPTQDISVPCQLAALNYDVYLIIDTSSAISASDFAQMKQMLLNFISPFAIGDRATQFALVATAADSELYGTSFHAGQDRNTLLNTIRTLSQDGSNGQTLKLSLQAISNKFLSQNYSTSNKVVVYVTGTTSWDSDPIQLMKQLAQKYGAKPVAIQWTSGASQSSLTSFVGGSACVNSVSNRATAATWLQTKMCRSFCM
ncbi:VWFA domain-containing protein [Trichostrongylus colubriformis]|uniref:VWFA domain-containing protein n=1 Tax=Trichostrongylus colubriformis TaxID=6319 RepID=A0AAN8IQC6_TRICO